MNGGSGTSADAAAALTGCLRESGARRVLLAVSGGSDSLALLRLAAAARAEALFAAATVDHGLRPESADEAEWVGRQCGEAGVGHVVLKWTDEKPATGLQEQARLARYRLLVGEAEARGFDAVMTAHTADDQAETVFMRLARGSGPRGLSGMAARSLIAIGAGAPLQLLRPLLQIGRQTLRDGLRGESRSWIDDPSNDDPRYERVRIRGLLAALEAQSLLTREALLATASRMQRAVERTEAAEDAAFREYEGLFLGLGFVRLRASRDLPSGLIARLIRAVGAGDHAPPEEEAGRALNRALGAGAATLGGAMLKASGGALYFFREGAALLGRAGVPQMPRAVLTARATALWDRRYILHNEGDAEASVEPLGANPAGLARMAALDRCPPEALAAAPDLGASPHLRLQSLLQERFDGKVMRIP